MVQIGNLYQCRNWQMPDHLAETKFADLLNVIPNENIHYDQPVIEGAFR